MLLSFDSVPPLPWARRWYSTCVMAHMRSSKFEPEASVITSPVSPTHPRSPPQPSPIAATFPPRPITWVVDDADAGVIGGHIGCTIGYDDAPWTLRGRLIVLIGRKASCSKMSKSACIFGP